MGYFQEEKEKSNIRISQFLGLNNRLAPEKLTNSSENTSYCRAAENVDFTRSGGFIRRQGITNIMTGDFHSLWSNGILTFCVRNNELGLLDGDLNFSKLIDASQRKFTYADTGAGIYLSDNQNAYRYITSLETLTRAGNYEFERIIEKPEEYYDSPLPGYHYSWCFGRLFIVRDDGVFYSRPFMPDRFDLEKDFWQINNVVSIDAVDSGIFVAATNGIIFLPGGNPSDINQVRNVFDGRVVKNTSVRVNSADVLSFELSGVAIIWETDKGKVLGLSDGSVRLLTQNNYAYHAGQDGAAYLKIWNGEIHHISSLETPRTENSMARTTDFASAEIRRNGIIIT